MIATFTTEFKRHDADIRYGFGRVLVRFFEKYDTWYKIFKAESIEAYQEGEATLETQVKGLNEAKNLAQEAFHNDCRNQLSIEVEFIGEEEVIYEAGDDAEWEAAV